MDKARTNNGGIGFVGLLTIVFIVLKLTKVISWSWIWVIAPIWICGLITIMVIIAAIIIAAIHEARMTEEQKRKRKIREMLKHLR